MKNWLPKLIFWETTKRCNLSCKHCRAGDLVFPLGNVDTTPIPLHRDGYYDRVSHQRELTFEEARNLVDQIGEFVSPPILVLSGGEPLYRDDIFDVIHYAKTKSIIVALATNGTLITESIAKKVREFGVDRVSISLDGTKAQTHDDLRGQKGSFTQAVNGFHELKKKGLSMQINFTVTKRNAEEMDSLIELALTLGADAVHLFFLVPVGCGQTIPEEYKLTPLESEKILQWLYEKSKDMVDKGRVSSPLHLKATCAPQYQRIKSREQTEHSILDNQRSLRGCLAGSGVCFVSHSGEIFPCGYLPISTGNIRRNALKEIWDNSDIFSQLRSTSLLKGKCRICGYREICTGCRARAFIKTNDYLEEDSSCAYQP